MLVYQRVIPDIPKKKIGALRTCFAKASKSIPFFPAEISWRHRDPQKTRQEPTYPLVIKHSNGKSPFFMGKSAINGHFQ